MIFALPQTSNFLYYSHLFYCASVLYHGNIHAFVHVVSAAFAQAGSGTVQAWLRNGSGKAQVCSPCWYTSLEIVNF
jgi:hypothetical protein